MGIRTMPAFSASFMDLLNRPEDVRCGFELQADDIPTCIDNFRDETRRINQGQMDVKGDLGEGPAGFDDVG